MNAIYKFTSISTHDLTRRSTIHRATHIARIRISTHDLTRRSTCLLLQERHIWIFISTHDLTRRSTQLRKKHGLCTQFQLTTSQGGRQQFLHKKFSFQNHFLCSLHIIHSYYINIAFFSTLFLQNLHFFWCESPRIFLFTCLSHSAF